MTRSNNLEQIGDLSSVSQYFDGHAMPVPPPERRIADAAITLTSEEKEALRRARNLLHPTLEQNNNMARIPNNIESRFSDWTSETSDALLGVTDKGKPPTARANVRLTAAQHWYDYSRRNDRIRRTASSTMLGMWDPHRIRRTASSTTLGIWDPRILFPTPSSDTSSSTYSISSHQRPITVWKPVDLPFDNRRNNYWNKQQQCVRSRAVNVQDFQPQTPRTPQNPKRRSSLNGTIKIEDSPDSFSTLGRYIDRYDSFHTTTSYQTTSTSGKVLNAEVARKQKAPVCSVRFQDGGNAAGEEILSPTVFNPNELRNWRRMSTGGLMGGERESMLSLRTVYQYDTNDGVYLVRSHNNKPSAVAPHKPLPKPPVVPYKRPITLIRNYEAENLRQIISARERFHEDTLLRMRRESMEARERAEVLRQRNIAVGKLIGEEEESSEGSWETQNVGLNETDVAILESKSAAEGLPIRC